MKTGAGGRWVEIEKPKPPKVDDRYRYWQRPPPELSPRCVYWLRQIVLGWRPNRRVNMHGYDGRAEWYGVYIWELLNVIEKAIALRKGGMT